MKVKNKIKDKPIQTTKKKQNKIKILKYKT